MQTFAYLWNQFSSVHSLSRVQLFATPWTTVRQTSLSITNSWPKLMSIESVMPSNHLILCRPLLFLPSVFPSITIFSNESAVCIRWAKNWSFSFRINSGRDFSFLCLFPPHKQCYGAKLNLKKEIRWKIYIKCKLMN